VTRRRLLAFLGLAGFTPAFTACAGAQGGSGWRSVATSWLNAIANDLPGLRAFVTGLSIDPTVKARILAAITAAQGTIQPANDAINGNTSTAECDVRTALTFAASTALAVGEALATVGFLIPGAVLSGIAGIASIIDSFLPACASSSPSPPPAALDVSARISPQVLRRIGALGNLQQIPGMP
jgi:hypothetical protein